MKVGLIDVDGHNFPNLALMKLSAWQKEFARWVNVKSIWKTKTWIEVRANWERNHKDV